jgi:glycerophosphoryl diester phosphodiesterase
MPENTLPGFAYALTTGVTTLEMDVAVSLDGTVIVSHDSMLSPALTRDANGDWLSQQGPALFALPVARIKSYDVGSINPDSRNARRFPDQKRMNGISIPTLDEVFDLVKRAGNRTVRFNIETKLNPGKPALSPSPPEFAAAVLAVVERHGLADRVTIQSFDWRTLQEIQRLNGGIRTSYLTAQQKWLDNIELGKPGVSPWTAGLDADDFSSIPDMIAKAGGRVWSPFHREADRQSVGRAHELGLEVAAWTVNDRDRMAEMIDMGVDGIITDDPALLREVMAARGLPLPPVTPVEP